MKKLTIGKLRGIQQIASPDGVLVMCAMDHRGSLQTMLNPEQPKTVTYEQMVEFKLELCATLAKEATAVLLDPIFGSAQCINRNVLPKGTGLLVSIEATGYEGSKEARITRLLDGWGVEKIKRMGASAVKILLFYRPDLRVLAEQQRKVISMVATDCIKYDIPFLVEPVSYPVSPTITNPADLAPIKSQLVIETARDITALPIDILKAEFPADLRYQSGKEVAQICWQLDAAAKVPWVVLSAGVDFDVFSQQVELACRAGASGFLGGRAIWQEVVRIKDAKERLKWLSTIGVDRVKRLTEIAIKYATPWYKKLGLAAGDLAPVTENWYKEY